MITPEKEYNELLYAIQNPNNAHGYYFRIPSEEPIYDIDLNTREIKIPEFLSVESDHNSEIIWFKVDRFYDDFDLYGSTCWIQYRNALKQEYITTSIPQIIHESNHDVLYIPWPISNAVAAQAGNVEFSFQFFKLSEDKQRIFYSLNTKPAIGKILHGLHVDPLKGFDDPSLDEEQFIPERSELLDKLARLDEAYSRLEKGVLLWSEIK